MEASECNASSHDQGDRSESNASSLDQIDRSESNASSYDPEDKLESNASSYDPEDKLESNTTSHDQEGRSVSNASSYDQDDRSESNTVSHEQETEQHEESQHHETKSEDTLISKLHWFFQPILPMYEMLKASNECTNKVFGVLEQIIFTLSSLLETSDLPSEDGKQNALASPDPLLCSLFKRWFQAHKNLRQSVYYIEAFYEEIVPLIPGQDPLFNDVDAKSVPIRIMCCYATLHMLCRLPYHTTIYIKNIFKQIKSFILKPKGQIDLEFL